MKKTKHRIRVWIIVWPKGTTKKWGELEEPKDYFPIGIEPINKDMYFDKKEQAIKGEFTFVAVDENKNPTPVLRFKE